jgi:hypothetical protein
MWAISIIFMLLPKANNHPLGEISPTLVNLNERHGMIAMT